MRAAALYHQRWKVSMCCIAGAIFLYKMSNHTLATRMWYFRVVCGQSCQALKCLTYIGVAALGKVCCPQQDILSLDVKLQVSGNVVRKCNYFCDEQILPQIQFDKVDERHAMVRCCLRHFQEVLLRELEVEGAEVSKFLEMLVWLAGSVTKTNENPS